MSPSGEYAAAPIELPADIDALAEQWSRLEMPDRVKAFKALPHVEADELFLGLDTGDQAELLLALPPDERSVWLRLLAPDDAVDVLQWVEEPDRSGLIALLDEAGRREVRALLAYAEDVAGGLMSPRFARLRADMTVDEAIRYLRAQARAKVETIYYAFVLDHSQRLQGIVSFRDLFAASGSAPVFQVMERDLVTVAPEQDQEEVASLFARYDLAVIPVVDAEGVMRGIITVDDVVDVVQEEATRDIHQIGAVTALDESYLDADFREMFQARVVWLALLFVGQTLTASAISAFEGLLVEVVALALFVPLVISSGGNSGSQAATLVVRAVALGEVELRDAWRVLRRELAAGLALGGVLAVLGASRVLLWEGLFGAYGPRAVPLAVTVGLSLIGVVCWGTISGALLPLVVKRVGFDPATASTPFVATLVDVVGLLIYFGVAKAVLGL